MREVGFNEDLADALVLASMQSAQGSLSKALPKDPGLLQ